MYNNKIKLHEPATCLSYFSQFLNNVNFFFIINNYDTYLTINKHIKRDDIERGVCGSIFGEIMGV